MSLEEIFEKPDISASISELWANKSQLPSSILPIRLLSGLYGFVSVCVLCQGPRTVVGCCYS